MVGATYQGLLRNISDHPLSQIVHSSSLAGALAAVTPSCGGSLNFLPSQPSCSYPTLFPTPGWALPIMISPGSVPCLGKCGGPILSLPPASSSLKLLKRAQFPRVQRALGDLPGQESHFDEEKWRFSDSLRVTQKVMAGWHGNPRVEAE